MYTAESMSCRPFETKWDGTTKKVNKGAWRMPWLTEATKDVISCDKPWGGANTLRSMDFRMGQPVRSDSDIMRIA